VNHIATGRALSPGGELLPPHHRRQQGRWRRRRRRWRSMEMAPGALPHPDRVPEQGLLSPEIRRRRRRRSCGTLSGNLPTLLAFSVGRLFIGGEAASGGCQGHLTTRGRGQGVSRATLWCGCPLAPLWLSFGLRPSSRKNRSF
jgi:hypothetical protein